MALTKVGPAGIGSTPGTGYTIGDSFLHSTGLDSTNAKFTGIVTAQTFRVLGNFQVDGTTTTLDTEVTSVDKLEVAANNTTVGVAITQSGSGDILNLYDGTTEVFTVTDGGNLGIGINNPQRKLVVSDAGTEGLEFFPGDAVNGSTINAYNRTTSSFTPFSLNALDYRFSPNGGTEAVRITSGGSVGIGTDIPGTTKLKIETGSGTRAISLNAPTNGTYITFETAGTAYADIGAEKGVVGSGSADTPVINARGSRDLAFRTNNAERLRITSGGDVNVGNISNLVASGAGKLNILSDNTTNLGIATDGAINIACASGAGVGRVQSINWVPGFNVTLPTASIGHVYTDAGGYGKGDLFFATRGSTSNAAATERLRITSAGDMGLGTTSPTNISNFTSFTLSGTTGGNIEFKDDNVLRGSIYNLADQFIVQAQGSSTPLSLRTNSLERLRITSAGNIGIGLVDPGTKLEVSGGQNQTANQFVDLFRIAANANNDSLDAEMQLNFGISASHTSTANRRARIQAITHSGTGRELSLNPDGGYVGVGTDDPGVALHVLSSSYPTATIQRDHAVNYPRLRLINTANDGADLDGIGDGTGGFRISTVDAGTSTERVRIFSNGYIGIGAANNTSYDTNAQNVLIASDGNTGITIRSAGSSPYAMIHFADGTSGNSQKRAGRIMYQHDGDNLAFSTADTERLRITGSGKVGIGILNPSEMLEINNTASTGSQIQLKDTSTGTANSDGVRIGYNGTGAQVWNFENTFFRIATNNAERLRILNDGKMGLGTVTPTQILELKTGEPRLCLNGTTANSDKGIEFEHNGSRMGHLFHNPTSGEMSLSVGENTGGAHYLTFKAGNGSEKMRISSGGNMGLGSNAPQHLLHLNRGTSATTSYKDATLLNIRGTNNANVMAGIGFGYSTTNPAASAYPSAWIGAKVSSWTAYVKHDLVFATRDVDTNTEPTERLRIDADGQPKFSTTRAMEFASSPTSASMFQFRLAISMVGNVAYTIRLRGFGNGAHYVRLMGSHWTSSYQLVKESYYYTDTYEGLSEDSIKNVSSGAQGAWSVSRPSNGQTGYTTDLIITKSAGSYGGGHMGMIDIITPADLYLVSIT